MSFKDDLDIFFSEFAVTAKYKPMDKDVRSVKVIFDNAYEAVSMHGEMAVSSALPTAYCKWSDIEGVKVNDTLEIDGITYYVIEIQPDGTGMVTLMLSRNRV